MDAEQQQHEGVSPLLEPAVIVVDNCKDCHGTGFRVIQPGRGIVRDGAPPWDGRDPLATDVPNNTEPCGECEGAGRIAEEVTLSDFAQMLATRTFRIAAPSPSEMRRGA